MKHIAYDAPAARPRVEHLLRDLDALTLMLEAGWRIEPPILARLSWAQRHTGELAYHVILERAAQRSLIVIDDSPTVHRFLDEHGIPVIEISPPPYLPQT
jgi:GAF domain-containing protein